MGNGIDVPSGATVLDAGGCLVAPGLVDLHTHLRQPGGEEAETVETAARATARGGYTAVLGMPNTNPTIDNAAVAREVLGLGASAMCRVAVAGAITVGRAGERLAPMSELAALGVTLFTDDGTGVQDAAVMRRALEYARGLGVTLGQHCEDGALAAGGHMNEGAWSSRLGVPGVPAAAEELMVARRHHAGPADRRPGPLPPSLHGPIAGPGGGGQGGRFGRHGRGDAAPPGSHRQRTGRL